MTTNALPAEHNTTHRLLTSPPFRRCRDEAELLEADQPAVRRLLQEAAGHAFSAGTLLEAGVGAEFARVCDAVEAHLAKDPARAPAPERARFRLLVSALLYVVNDDDVIPDHWPDGHLDDIAVVRWADRLVS